MYLFQHKNLIVNYLFKIIKMNKCLIAFLIILNNHQVFSQNINYTIGDTLNIFALSGLKIREEGHANSKVLASMKFGEKVVVLDTFSTGNKSKQTIEGFGGSWIKVRYDAIEGYVFDGFLSALPVPKMNYRQDIRKMKARKGKNSEGYAHEIEDAFKEYMNTEFDSINEPMEYFNGYDGESTHYMYIQKMSHNCIKIEHGGHESYGVDLEIIDGRLAEVKNLLLILGDRSGLDADVLEKLKNSLKKVSEKGTMMQEALNLGDFQIRIKHYRIKNQHHKWVIVFDQVTA